MLAEILRLKVRYFKAQGYANAEAMAVDEAVSEGLCEIFNITEEALIYLAHRV